MKKSQYKGTPHPKKRQPLDVITNKQDAAASAKKSTANSSPLKRLHVVHSSVARLLEKIDSMVTGIHKKRLSEKLSAEEINNFNRAMLNVEGTLQEWQTFFLQASKRTNLTESRRYHQDVHNDNLIPIIPTAEKSFHGALSDSPLVSGASDQSRKFLHFRPQLSSSASRNRKQQTPAASSIKKVRFQPQTPSTSSNSKKVTFASTPQTITPTMPSPPHSVRLRRPSITSSSSSCLSTPSFLLRSAESPSSVELATPQAPAEIVSKYPKWFSKASTGSQSDKSPAMTVSPPKTCSFLRPLGSAADELHDYHSPIALPPISPFRTPGLMLLRSPSLAESSVSDPGTEDLTSKLAAVGSNLLDNRQ